MPAVKKSPAADAESERRDTLLVRTRMAAALGVFASACTIPADLAIFTDQLPARIGALAGIGAVSAASGLLTFVPGVHRFARPLAIAMMLGISGFLFRLIAFAPQDLDVMSGPIAITMIGTCLIFPWGGYAQMLVSGVLLAGWAALLPKELLVQPSRSLNLAVTVADGLLLSIIAAWLLERHRRRAFAEREHARGLARQRALLLDANRALNDSLDVGALQDRIARLGHDLVGADTTFLTVRDPARGTWRLVSIAGQTPPNVDTITACEFDDAAMRPVLDCLHISASFDAFEHESLAPVRDYLTRQLGLAHLLYVAVRREQEPLGLLHFGYVDPAAHFDASQRRVAEGFAHQAAIALHNARLIDHLQTANMLKTQFVSTMSHELRTPLLVVMGYAELLELSDTDRAMAVERIQTASRELLGLIEATLDVARLEAGMHGAVLQALPLRSLWTELQSACADLPRGAGVEVCWEAPRDLVVQTDRRKLTMVVKNLVSNATKFTPQGIVVVTSAVDGQHVRLDVRDTGIGIAPETLPHVFEMFRQGDAADTRTYGGVGLGLYLARRLCEEIDAEIAVESTIGVGSTFSVRVPLAPAPAARQLPTGF